MKIGNLEVYGVIYKITNKVNGKVYIGQTVNGFNRRYDRGGNTNEEKVYMHHLKNKNDNLYYNKHLLCAMKKYGIESFEVLTTVDVAFSKVELDIKEDLHISLHNSVINGYNEKYGGGNGKASESTKAKMRENNRGEGNPNYGKTHSDSTRHKMRINHWSKTGKYKPTILKGELNHNYGRKHSEDTKRRISERNIGKVMSESTKQKLSADRLGKNNPVAKSVICITTNTRFDTITEASLYYNCNVTDISKCCKRKQKHHGSHGGKMLAWAYQDKWDSMTAEEQEGFVRSLERKDCTIKVICLTTNMVFDSILKASQYYKCSAKNIRNCCKGVRETAGQFEGKDLKWEYLK